MTKGDLIALIAFAVFNITALIILTVLIIGILLPPVLLLALVIIGLAVILLVDTLCILIIAMFAEPLSNQKRQKRAIK